jgi:hypothetical protein
MTEKAIIRPHTAAYVAGRSGTGKKTLINGDPVSLALVGATPRQAAIMLVSLSRQLIPGSTLTVDEVVSKYAHLNVGLQRMSIGNRIRGVVAKMNKDAEGTGDEALEEQAQLLSDELESASAAEADSAAA